MKIEFHGAASEVGRSCIELKLDNGERYLLDVGIKFQEDGFLLPENVLEIPKVDGVFLSHAHLDHSGGLPLFEHKDLKGPIFCTRQTLAITKILLKDSYKIARIRRMHAAYDNLDLKEVQKDAKFVDFDKWYEHKSVRFMYLNAGHVPGSAMILLEAEGKRILYTADFNLRKSLLMQNCEINDVLREKPIDILISESTYGDKELPDRALLEEKFIKSIEETIKKGGSVLIPVFSLGRAQEALILLSKHNWPVKIYIDGMAKSLTREILETNGKYVDNKDALSKMFYKKTEWVGSDKHRKDALQKQGIFVTTSGMLQGGPVLSYLHELWHDPRNKVTLMGFQCKRTNGRTLLDEGYVYLDGWRTIVKCQVEKYDFSGHSDKTSIMDFIKQLNPRQVFFQHGDEVAVNAMKTWAEKAISGKAYAPKVGDSYIIS
jgi:putative mRNA 3-end processing factor